MNDETQQLDQTYNAYRAYSDKGVFGKNSSRFTANGTLSQDSTDNITLM